MSIEPSRASLLGLPAELRLSIYAHLLRGATVRLGRHCHSTPRPPGRRNSSCWAVLQTCRQIRREAWAPFFASVGFEVHDGFTEQALRAWMRVVGPDALACLGRMFFFCKGRCRMYGAQPDTDYCHRIVVLDLSVPRDKFAAALAADAQLARQQHRQPFFPSSDARQRIRAYHIPMIIPLWRRCSNGVETCAESTAGAVRKAGEAVCWVDRRPCLTEGDLLEIWRAANRDNCSSNDG